MKLRIALPALLASLAACTTPPAEAPSKAGVIELPPAAMPSDGQLDFRLASGTYYCDRGLRVEVTRGHSADEGLEIGWTGKRYRLVRNRSHSGLPRYEDTRSGLVWIDLPWKGILLDANANRPLASDCRAS